MTTTAAISRPRAAASHDSSIGALLVASGKISQENGERVLRMQQELGIRYGDAARRLGLVSDADIEQVLARQFDYPYVLAGESSLSPLLYAAFEPFSAQAEVLRTVRSQLMQRWFSHGHKSLAIASIDSGAGASALAANLAIVFSQLGEQTLLVDANLRTPRQQELFGLKGRQGLSDMLAGRAEMGSLAAIDGMLDLTVLGAGTLPPNPHELLCRPAFANLHGHWLARHDVVLYDAPPITSGADALALAARTGGLLLVARKDHTSLDDVVTLVEQLRHCGAAVVGSVLLEF